jgi:multidrug efflux pump subunit AcrA (membrane-fusion protein)
MPLRAESSSDSEDPSPDHFVDPRQFERQFPRFCLELHREPSLITTPAAIAAEFQRIFRSDRTWVLLPSGTKWQLQAVSNIPGFQRRADVVWKLEQLMTLLERTTLKRTEQSFQWSVGDSTSGLPPRVRQGLDQYLDEAHVCLIRVEPLRGMENQTDAAGDPLQRDLIGMVVCEWFQPTQFQFAEPCWGAARQQAAIALQNAVDWSRTPLAMILRRGGRAVSWRSASAAGIAFAAIGLGILLTAVIQIDLNVEALGELKPVRQRHVFATSTSIVRSLAVTSGTNVQEGATLLELDNPELELEIRRADGELQTAEKRIAAIETTRLDFGLSSPDAVNQMNSLAGELKEQQQKRENLRHELELLSFRRDELKVVSPIRGRVVTWDLERLLSRRPVARGQRLLTISDIDGPWELELRVADEETSDLLQAFSASKSVPLDFVVVTQPERMHTTTLKSISQTVEIRIAGDAPSLLCRADVPENLVDGAVEGMSVRGRIHCGRRAVIVVLFRKFWRTVKEHVLFPWGW